MVKLCDDVLVVVVVVGGGGFLGVGWCAGLLRKHTTNFCVS